MGEHHGLAQDCGKSFALVLALSHERFDSLSNTDGTVSILISVFLALGG